MGVNTEEPSDQTPYGSLEETQATDWECVMFPNFNIPPLIFHSADIPMALWGLFSPWNFQKIFILTQFIPANHFCPGQTH